MNLVSSNGGLIISGGGTSSDSIEFDGKGIWAPQTEYHKGNVLSVNGQVRMVRENHTTGNTVDGSLYVPIESQKGWATKVDRVIQEVVDLSNFNFEAGYSYVFLVEPYPTPLPTGCYVGEQLYCDGGSFIHLRDYTDMPETFICDGVVWYKYKWSWMCDTEWLTYSPVITASVGTAPTGTGVVFSLQYKLVGDTMHMLYQRSGSASSTGGSGPYLLGMPTGVRINTSKAIPDLTYVSQASGTLSRTKSLPLGQGLANWNGTGFPLTVFAYDENRYFFECAQGASSSQVKVSSNLWFAMNDAQATITANMQIPIKRKWEL